MRREILVKENQNNQLPWINKKESWKGIVRESNEKRNATRRKPRINDN